MQTGLKFYSLESTAYRLNTSEWSGQAYLLYFLHKHDTTISSLHQSAIVVNWDTGFTILCLFCSFHVHLFLSLYVRKATRVMLLCVAEWFAVSVCFITRYGIKISVPNICFNSFTLQSLFRCYILCDWWSWQRNYLSRLLENNGWILVETRL